MNLDAAVEQGRREDAKVGNKKMLAASLKPEPFTWRMNPNHPRIQSFLASSSRLRAFVVHIQLRSLG
jgi:hypothetical protein